MYQTFKFEMQRKTKLLSKCFLKIKLSYCQTLEIAGCDIVQNIRVGEGYVHNKRSFELLLADIVPRIVVPEIDFNGIVLLQSKEKVEKDDVEVVGMLFSGADIDLSRVVKFCIVLKLER